MREHESQADARKKLAQDRKEAKASDKKLKKTIAKAYDQIDDDTPVATLRNVVSTLLKALRSSLQLNLVTEQSPAIQEMRSLVSELLSQIEEKTEGECSDLRSQVPPFKTISGEGWGWVPKKWFQEVGVHLFQPPLEQKTQ